MKLYPTMLEKTGKNDVMKTQSIQEKINFLEGNSSDKSVKSQHEFSTELNDKNLLEKLNSKDNNYKSLKIVVPLRTSKKKHKRNSLAILKAEKNDEKIIIVKNKISKRKRGRMKEEINTQSNRVFSRKEGKILDFDRFLEEIYNKDNPLKERVVLKKKKKIKPAKNIDSKNVSSYKKKSKVKINKNAALYDLDNFVIQSSQSKIIDKKLKLDIYVPKYKELDLKFFNLPNFKVTKQIEDEDREDISDEAYLKFHRVYESREKEYRINYYKKKKSSDTTMKKEDNEPSIKISRFGADNKCDKDFKRVQNVGSQDRFNFLYND